MKAIVKYKEGKGFVELREVPMPIPGPQEVRIHVEFAGICASDLHILNYDIAITIKPPVVMGHEFSGVIDQLGAGVEGWKVGDRVVCEANYEVCGTCRYCTSGFYNLCTNRKVLGYWHNGCFAPYTVVPAKRLHALPTEITFQQGALIEPTACVVHGVCELISIQSEDVVLVTGPGAIGLTAAQVAKALGAHVIVSGTAEDSARLAVAKSLGADTIVDVSREDLADKVKQLTGGVGVDVVLECSGNDHAVRSGIDVIRKQGQFLQLGLLGRNMEIRWDSLVYKEIHAVGSVSSRDVSWKRAIELIRKGEVRPEALVGRPYELQDWESAFRVHEQKKELKILFRPH
ncbi:MAG: zinc-binding dehydrogenase [Spirochaetia bacterium]|jgi:L-iditol 2-dehydrogenase